jgi:exosome complex component RRP42
MQKNVISEINKDHIFKLGKNHKRIDGRGFEDFRSIEVEKDIIGTAEGSAKVRIGNTVVLVGVKFSIGEPYPDSPGEGVLTTNAELNPIAAPEFDSGPLREMSIELARVVDRGIRESGTIDLSELCIIEGEKVWVVYIDINVLDYDGNLFDASSLGALLALTTAKIPVSTIEDGAEDKPLPVIHYPVSCTAVKLGNFIVLDPTLDEENISDARLTVTTDENGDIRAMQKGVGGSFTIPEIKNVIKLSQQTGKYVRENIINQV